jgi:hypothetical protein
MPQNPTKIQGKFYPLQQEEWLAACRELTQAQLTILYYIRTSDPYNQGIEINCAEIARQISSPERAIHRQTVSRALKELVVKGYLPDKYRFVSAPADDTEHRIRDRLHAELGGQVEVVTAVGQATCSEFGINVTFEAVEGGN